MKRGMNRRAQAGVESKTINWIIAFMVLLAVGLGIYFFMEKAGTIGTNLPGAEEAISQGCAMAASSGLQQAYCTQFRKLADDKYITCNKAKENGILIDSPLVESFNLICDGMQEELKIKVLRECTEGDFKGDEKVMINGKTCVELGKEETCAKFDGVWSPTACASITHNDITYKVLDMAGKKEGDKYCCLQI